MDGNLDALEERRDMVFVRLANYQQKLAQGYNKKVRPREFVLGDLILRKAIGSMKDHNVGKFGFVSHTKHIAEVTNMDLLHS